MRKQPWDQVSVFILLCALIAMIYFLLWIPVDTRAQDDSSTSQEEDNETDTSTAYICVTKTVGVPRLIALTNFDSLGFVFAEDARVTIYSPVIENINDPQDVAQQSLYIHVIPSLIEDAEYGTYRVRAEGLMDQLRTHSVDSEESTPCADRIGMLSSRLASDSIRVRPNVGIVVSLPPVITTIQSDDEQENTENQEQTSPDDTSVDTPFFIEAPEILGSLAFHFLTASTFPDFEILLTSETSFDIALPDINETDLMVFSNRTGEDAEFTELGRVLNPGNRRSLDLFDQSELMLGWTSRSCTDDECGTFYEDVMLGSEFKTLPVAGAIFDGLPASPELLIDPEFVPSSSRFSVGDQIAINQTLDGCLLPPGSDLVSRVNLYRDSGGVEYSEVLTGGGATIVEINVEGVMPLELDTPAREENFYSSAICVTGVEAP